MSERCSHRPHADTGLFAFSFCSRNSFTSLVLNFIWISFLAEFCLQLLGCLGKSCLLVFQCVWIPCLSGFRNAEAALKVTTFPTCGSGRSGFDHDSASWKCGCNPSSFKDCSATTNVNNTDSLTISPTPCGSSKVTPYNWSLQPKNGLGNNHFDFTKQRRKSKESGHLRHLNMSISTNKVIGLKCPPWSQNWIESDRQFVFEFWSTSRISKWQQQKSE